MHIWFIVFHNFYLIHTRLVGYLYILAWLHLSQDICETILLACVLHVPLASSTSLGLLQRIHHAVCVPRVRFLVQSLPLSARVWLDIVSDHILFESIFIDYPDSCAHYLIFRCCVFGPACQANMFASLPGASVCQICTAHASSLINAAECICDPGIWLMIQLTIQNIWFFTRN